MLFRAGLGCSARSRGGRGGRSLNRRGAAGCTGQPSTHYRASGAVPPAPFAASPAQGGNPLPFRGFARSPYQGQRSYGRSQPYHPYSRAPGPGRGRGRGHGQRGSDMYQVQSEILPPVAAGTSRPEGNPPDDLHFAEGNYAQNSALEEPHLERWVTGYSDDSGTPQESTYVSGSVYEYAPESYYDEEEEDYYYGEEE